jgi:hypothetical protein
MELKKAFDAWHEDEPGTEEYRLGRVAYYALQELMLGDLKGGKVLIGGLDQRLAHVKHFTVPRHIPIGSGPKADRALVAWEAYLKVRERELAKGANADHATIQKAWDKFAGGKTGDKGSPGIELREVERGRVRMWHLILETAHKYRAVLEHSHSDYYRSQGNSAKLKLAQKYVGDINEFVREAIKVNPAFAADIEQYFQGRTNIGGKLLDWYPY